MFCGKCGTQLENNALFCPNCGEKTTNHNLSTLPSKKFNFKKLAIPAGAIAGLLVVVILVVSLVGGGGYKKTIDNYFNAYTTNDPELMYESVIAQYWIDYMNEGWGNSAFESIEEGIEDNIEEWDCGDNLKITYEIENERRATKEQLEDLEDNIYDWYAYYVYERDEFEITDAYVLDINFTVKGDEGVEERYFPDGLLVIKENGKWRVTRGSIGSSFYDNQ